MDFRTRFSTSTGPEHGWRGQQAAEARFRRGELAPLAEHEGFKEQQFSVVPVLPQAGPASRQRLGRLPEPVKPAHQGGVQFCSRRVVRGCPRQASPKVGQRLGRAEADQRVAALQAVFEGRDALLAQRLQAQGGGDGAGRARLARSYDSQGANARLFRGAVTFRFGHVPMLGTDAAEKEPIEVHMADGDFEFELPKWFSARV